MSCHVRRNRNCLKFDLIFLFSRKWNETKSIKLIRCNSFLFVSNIYSFCLFVYSELELDDRAFGFEYEFQVENKSSRNIDCRINRENPTDAMMDTNKFNEMKINGTVGGQNRNKMLHTGLLRRRHSLPEIIMRKWVLQIHFICLLLLIFHWINRKSKRKT